MSNKIQDNQQTAIEDKKMTIFCYAFIRGYDHSAKCVVLAKSKEQAEQTAKAKGLSIFTAECKAFATDVSAQRCLKI